MTAPFGSPPSARPPSACSTSPIPARSRPRLVPCEPPALRSPLWRPASPPLVRLQPAARHRSSARAWRLGWRHARHLYHPKCPTLSPLAREALVPARVPPDLPPPPAMHVAAAAARVPTPPQSVVTAAWRRQSSCTPCPPRSTPATVQRSPPRAAHSMVAVLLTRRVAVYRASAPGYRMRRSKTDHHPLEGGPR